MRFRYTLLILTILFFLAAMALIEVCQDIKSRCDKPLAILQTPKTIEEEER